jgi:hypothetical protein
MKPITIFFIVPVLALLLQGCNNSPSDNAPAVSIAPPKPDHYYEVVEDMAYGYTAALSLEDKQRGVAAPKVLMFRYAGMRDGKHQVHQSDGMRFTAIECSNPCEVLKIMTFIDQDYLRSQVHVERMKNMPGSIANRVFEDALKGKLKTYGIGRGKNNFQPWVDEKAGYREHLVKEKG